MWPKLDDKASFLPPVLSFPINWPLASHTEILGLLWQILWRYRLVNSLSRGAKLKVRFKSHRKIFFFSGKALGVGHSMQGDDKGFKPGSLLNRAHVPGQFSSLLFLFCFAFKTDTLILTSGQRCEDSLFGKLRALHTNSDRLSCAEQMSYAHLWRQGKNRLCWRSDGKVWVGGKHGGFSASFL